MGDKALHARNREIARQYFGMGRTLADIGREYGITGDRVKQIVLTQEWRSKAWMYSRCQSLLSHMPIGQLIPPQMEVFDIGEGLPWGPELQHFEFELEKEYR
ncbi:MAG: hypothetical protein EB015_11705 [Methylocystaceae bacterium]|nr:hypothetical protein [Methylocystaceae bacterium]